jgi:hypothetical protein
LRNHCSGSFTLGTLSSPPALDQEDANLRVLC